MINGTDAKIDLYTCKRSDLKDCTIEPLLSIVNLGKITDEGGGM